jgi:hypothetical protein
MADQTATFAIELEDKVSGPTASAAGALKRLGDQISADKRALSQMQQAMKNLQGGSVVNIKQFQQLQQQIVAKKGAIAQAQSSFLSLGGTFNKTSGSGAGLQAKLAALAKQAQVMPGPLGGLIARFSSLAGAVGSGLIAAGIVAIVAALALLVVATAAAVNALARYGVAQADARRSELLRLEGLTKIRYWYATVAGNAAQMQGAIDKVSASTALGRDKVAAYSEQLYRMGLRGENLSAALEGVAIKASVQGEEQATMFAGWAAGAALTGRSVRKLADDVKSRLGGIAEKQMLSLTVQTVKQQEAFAALFSGLNIEPFLKAKKIINDLFSQSTASGRALKQLLTLLVQPLVNAVTAAAPVVKRFFQGLILGALDIAITILEVRAAFRRTFGGGEATKGIDLTTAAITAGKVAVGLFATGLAVAAVAAVGLGVQLVTWLVPAMWGLVASAGALALEGLVIAAPFLLAAAAIFAVINTGRLLYQLWKEIDWTDLGRSIWQGIVGGLKSGAQWVVDAVTNIGKAASAAFKNALGIASPSKAFQNLGAAIPAGVTLGVEQGTPAARRAVRGIVHAPTVSTARAAVPDSSGGAPRVAGSATAAPSTTTPGAAKAAAGGSVTINQLHVHATSDKPRELALDIKRELEAILEGVAIQLGAPIAGTT